MTCCFTGHRELPETDSEAYRALLKALEAAVRDARAEGCTRFLVGGAKGFDLLAGEWIAALKKVDPAITLAVYVPYRGQANSFTDAEKARYRALLDAADETVILSETYRRGCMRERNAKMVRDADLCIAYVRRRPSGSAQTMRLAEQKGIPVFLL
jgi:uncharacterized phage-like protein YoqJ